MERVGKHAADRERSGSGRIDDDGVRSGRVGDGSASTSSSAVVGPQRGEATSWSSPASASASGSDCVVVTHLDVVRGGRTILRDVSLTVARGSIIGLLGPSGCGKTTLMRSIVGVQKIAGGSIEVLGLATGARELRGRIGYVTQQVSVYADLTVKQNVEYFATLYGVGRDAVAQAMETVGLSEYAARRVSQLSGGQASRASLACALVGNPEVLVLDEPTVGLDPVTRTELWDTFRALAGAGHTLIVSSHVMDEATRCDSLLLMREGEVLGQLTPEQLMRRTGAASPDEAFLLLIKNRDVGRRSRHRREDGVPHAQDGARGEEQS
ncbi:MAG: ABC transporter ATP-binding protein [Ancrocorticia sp.]